MSFERVAGRISGYDFEHLKCFDDGSCFMRGFGIRIWNLRFESALCDRKFLHWREVGNRSGAWEAGSGFWCHFATSKIYLCLGELKHEVFWETLGITLNSSPIQCLCLDLVKLGQVRIEPDLLAANQIDPPLDQLHGNGQVVGYALRGKRDLAGR